MKEQSWVKHLIEIRRRLLQCVFVFFVVFMVLFLLSDQLFLKLAGPLLHHLPKGNSLIATSITAPFITPLKFCFIVSLIVTMPFWLFQLWAFIAPALYQSERQLLWFLLLPAIALFYIGIGFAYFVVFPLVFGFFTSIVPAGIQLMPDMSQYLDFTLKLFFAFGLAFEVPVLTVMLILLGVCSRESLAQKRPHVIVGAFFVGMILTPPDVISQILLAVPMLILFELGLLLSRVLPQKVAHSV